MSYTDKLAETHGRLVRASRIHWPVRRRRAAAPFPSSSAGVNRYMERAGVAHAIEVTAVRKSTRSCRKGLGL